MPENFQQVVNLKEKIAEQKRAEERRVRGKAEEGQKTAWFSAFKFKLNFKIIKTAATIIILLFVALSVYGLFFGHSTLLSRIFKDKNWYLVKLTSGEIFYGQIFNTSADPIIMFNVYYNYDQVNKEPKDPNAPAGLRLIKRGQETHSPDGTMDIVRSQVLIMERLKSDSELLKAMLNYENKAK